MSYWTKRREVAEQVRRHMENIAQVESASAMANQNESGAHESAGSIANQDESDVHESASAMANQNESDVHESTNSMANQNESDAHESSVNDVCSVENEGLLHTHEVSSQNYEQEHERSQEYEDTCSSFSDTESSSSSDDEFDFLGNPLFYSDDSDLDDTCYENDIRIQLCNWAITHNITHTALRELLKILKPKHESLPKDPRTLLSTGKVDGVVAISGGWYYHFGIANGILAKLSSSHFKLTDDENQEIAIQINVDGLPLFKSTNAQFWPILGLIRKDSNRSEPFIIGLYSGNQKPGNPDEFLRDFVDEMQDLQVNGLHYNGSVFQVVISAFICDAPARAFIKKIKYHTGYSSCEKCTTRGEYDGTKVVLPCIDAPLRTNQSFNDMADENHHTGLSPLSTELHFNMITGFPLDPMHLVHLGITRRLLNLWLKGPLRFRIGRLEKMQISQSLLSFRGFIPKEFARKPRDLAELDRWKATELRAFLLYFGPVVLKGRISEEMFNNFMLLSTGINILTNPVFCHLFCNYARELLQCFIRHLTELYGRDQVVYNVHSAQHLASDVELHGPLDQFSAFPFENYMHALKALVRKPNFALQQVILRLTEKSEISSRINMGVSTFSTSSLEPVLKMEHSDGPLPSWNYRPCTQFRDAIFPECVISSKSGDNCVKVGSDIVLVRNVFQSASGTYIIYNRFHSSESYFLYPLDSRHIDVYRVSRLSTNNKIADISTVTKKFVLLPCLNGDHVAFPLTHTF